MSTVASEHIAKPGVAAVVVANRWTARLLLAAVIVLGVVLRVAGINFGLPQLYHWDEKMYFHSAFYAIATGGSTDSLVHGNIPYLLVPVLWLVAIGQGIAPGGSGLRELVTSYLTDPSPFYLVGRLLLVAFQVLGIGLCYVVGVRALSRRAGLITAFFVAGAFLAVSESHYVKGDTLAMTAVLLCCLSALVLIERPTYVSYLLLGAALGLAFACKLTTAALVALPLVVHWLACASLQERIRRAPRLLFTALGTALGFLVTLPAPLADLPGTLDILRIETGARFPSEPTDGAPAWLYYWTGHLANSFGWPLLLVSLAGVVLWLVRPDRRRVVLFACLVLLYAGLLARPNNFARYAIPLIPFLALAAADLLDRAAVYVCKVVSNLRPLVGRLGFALVVLLLAVPGLANDLRYDRYISAPDTRMAATRMLERVLPPGTSVVEDGGQGFEAASILGPPIRPDVAAAGVTWGPTSLRPPDAFWREPLLTWLRAYTPTYRLTFAPSITRRSEITSTAYWGDPDAFVFISWRNDPEQDRQPSPFWADLHRKYSLTARFDCNPCFPDDPYAFSISYDTLARVDVAGSQVVAGPRIWVYRRNR